LTRCPACGGDTTTQVADQDAILEEMERLWSFHGRRLRHPVPPRYLTDRVVFSQLPPIRLVTCCGCGHVYRNPCERAIALREVYAGAAADEGVYRSLLAVQRTTYTAQVRRVIKLSGRVHRGLEVGSYVGGFLAAARDAGCSFTGLDVNADASAFAARQGFQVIAGAIEDVDPRQPYDAVVIWNTFEQLPDGRLAASAARRLMRDGGTFAVRVPNGDFYIQWRRRLSGSLGTAVERMLAHNNLLGFPYRQGFTASSIARVLSDAGFTIEAVHGDTLVPIADRWTTSFGMWDERLTKGLQRVLQHAWRAPWVEVYARAA
jgi:SAM-dependent methyltransferase